MKNWKLRTRFVITFSSLIVLGFAGLFLIAGQQISQGATEDFERDLEQQASLVARGLREDLENFHEGELSQTSLENTVGDYAGRTNTRITLIDTTGRAWLDSTGAPPAENQRNYLEVAAALENRTVYDVRPDAAGNTTVYAAAAVTEEGQVLSIVQISTPLTHARGVVLERWLTLGGGVVLLTAAAVIAALWLSASLTRPLSQLRDTANQMAAGNLEQRLPENRRDEIGELAAAFNHMAEQVDAMLVEQRAFASNAAHELRTPITAIRLRSEALREGALDEATKQQYIAEIDEEAARMGDLVQDLIMLSRLEGGRASRGQEQISPWQLAHSLMREFQPQAAGRHITLTLDAPEELPAQTASLAHMRIVFRNLLSNALKYTPDGGRITWKIRVAGGEIYHNITDTGQGIAPEDLPHVFERFYRADKARTRQVDGVGLGLSLVQTVVALYDGRITISSPGLGQGTTVELWWPVDNEPQLPSLPKDNRKVLSWRPLRPLRFNF